MHNPTPRRWQRWRATSATPVPQPDCRNRLVGTEPLPVAEESGSESGPDGIRHELVARIRRAIAEGTYDTEEKWLAAEAELLRRIESRI
jgi:hypothetical protein